jgi:hypothetical protein
LPRSKVASFSSWYTEWSCLEHPTSNRTRPLYSLNLKGFRPWPWTSRKNERTNFERSLPPPMPQLQAPWLILIPQRIGQCGNRFFWFSSAHWQWSRMCETIQCQTCYNADPLLTLGRICLRCISFSSYHWVRPRYPRE